MGDLSVGFELLPLWQLDYLATPGGISPQIAPEIISYEVSSDLTKVLSLEFPETSPSVFTALSKYANEFFTSLRPNKDRGVPNLWERRKVEPERT